MRCPGPANSIGSEAGLIAPLSKAGDSCSLTNDKTRQGYALRSILKPAGCLFLEC